MGRTKINKKRSFFLWLKIGCRITTQTARKFIEKIYAMLYADL